MKLLHTADWQIGMKAAHAGARAAEVREARLRSAARVVELATQHRVDALVLAGDTFEDNAVDATLVRRVAELLARATCRVFVLAGNHDPLGAGSVYRHPVWGEVATRVHVFADATPVEIDGAVLLPSPCAEKYSSVDPTLRIARGSGSKPRVGVAHGSLLGQAREVKADDFPIAPDAAERAQVDYLALGHWHSTIVLPSTEAARVAYPGTHETTSFGERDSGHALLVTLGTPGEPARVEVLDTGELRWIAEDRTLLDDADVAALGARLDSLPAPERTLVRLRLDGALGRSGFELLQVIEEKAAARFLSARVERAAVGARPEDAASWVAAVPEGVARTVAERLLGTAAAGGEEAEVARHALGQLLAHARRL